MTNKKMKEAKAIQKIKEDFEGAKKYWGSHFSKWAFVHNADSGLPPHVQKVILDFEDANKGKCIDIKHWGLEELRTIFRQISLEDKELWLGPAPSKETKIKLGFADLQPILEKLATHPVPYDLTIKNIPQKKIEANALSESVAILIKEGMSKADLVSQFFDKWHDPEFGEKISNSFKIKYKELKKQKFTPNKIFIELQTWVGGDKRGTPEHELAVLTVLAYYFERCDIFEEPIKE